jgi:hypothetical protein
MEMTSSTKARLQIRSASNFKLLTQPYVYPLIDLRFFARAHHKIHYFE